LFDWVVFLTLSLCCFVFFFFSSRRRHTRFSRDWSSDVCSSDLPTARQTVPPDGAGADAAPHAAEAAAAPAPTGPPAVPGRSELRSEERRVGKECRSRWAAEQEQKKERGRDRID